MNITYLGASGYLAVDLGNGLYAHYQLLIRRTDDPLVPRVVSIHLGTFAAETDEQIAERERRVST